MVAYVDKLMLKGSPWRLAGAYKITFTVFGGSPTNLVDADGLRPVTRSSKGARRPGESQNYRSLGADRIACQSAW